MFKRHPYFLYQINNIPALPTNDLQGWQDFSDISYKIDPAKSQLHFYHDYPKFFQQI